MLSKRIGAYIAAAAFLFLLNGYFSKSFFTNDPVIDGKTWEVSEFEAAKFWIKIYAVSAKFSSADGGRRMPPVWGYVIVTRYNFELPPSGMLLHRTNEDSPVFKIDRDSNGGYRVEMSGRPIASISERGEIDRIK